MVKTNLRIVKHEDKTGKTGKDYTRFMTSNGWMSSFDRDIINSLKDSENRVISCEVTEKENNGKTFYNIVKFFGIVHGLEAEKLDKAIAESQEIIETIKMNGKPDKDKSALVGISVSYAKDIACAEIMAGIKKEERSDIRALSKFFLGVQKELVDL